MKRYSLYIGACVLLVGCSAQQQGDAVAEARRICAAAQPVLTAASMVPDPRVQAALPFITAMCGPLLAGQVPPTLDANTPAWLSGLVATLGQSLAK